MMMATEYYVFTGRERIPRHVTHVLIDKALKFAPARAFYEHPNIQEVICHDGVLKIEQYAFYECPNLQEVICHDSVVKIEQSAFCFCPNLRRVIMPGAKVVERWAFSCCKALTFIECGKLVRIGEHAFRECTSLSSIDLPSIKIVEFKAFDECTSLTNVKFGKDLESIGEMAFHKCTSMKRITLPLKNGMIIHDSTFSECKMECVDLVEGAILDDTIDALLIEEWKNDMNEEIDAINRIVASAPAGNIVYDGGKAREIRTWIRSVLRKVIYHKAEHRRYLNVAAATLQTALPNEIVLNNVLTFLELPPYKFQGEI